MAKMDFEALGVAAAAAITDAASYIDYDIGPDRALASAYYRGEPFGNEEEGRSKLVSRDVHDVVKQYLPSLLRVFLGPEKVVEFAPEESGDVEGAKQATEYVNYIFLRDNPGFQILYAVLKDALIRKAGFVKYWWDESVTTKTSEYTGLDDMGLAKLLEDLSTAQEAEVVESFEDENGLSVKIKLTRRKDRVIIEAIPPEEFLISRNARDLDSAPFKGHRSMKTVSDLVAMGYDREEVEDASQDADELALNQEAIERSPDAAQWGVTAGDNDPSMKLVLYVEGYMKADIDGDGVAELVKVCTIGPEYKLVHFEEVEDHPFADFPSDPEPHAFFGECPAEDVMDLQLAKSALLRNAMDGLALSLNPRTVVIEGRATMDDVLNTEVGAVIRAKQADAVLPIVTPDTSPSAFAALTYMDKVKESRTGMSLVSQGLNPDTLQNMTATASSAQFTQSQQHIEVIARIVAETGLKKLFRGILKLVVANQRRARMINLRNQFVPMDPRGWKADMDVISNVALGSGTTQEKMQFLALVAQKQEQIIMQAGMDNPLCDLSQLRQTYSQMVQLAGFKDPDAFFKEVPKADPNAPKPPPPPDPKLVEVQMEQERKNQEAMANLQLKQAEAQSAAELKRMELDAKLQMQREEMAAKLEMQREQGLQEIALKERELAAELELKRELGLVAAVSRHDVQSTRVSSDVKVGGEPG